MMNTELLAVVTPPSVYHYGNHPDNWLWCLCCSINTWRPIQSAARSLCTFFFSRLRSRRIGIQCSRGLRPMDDPFVLSCYDLSTLSGLIQSNLIGSNHPVLSREAGHFFKGNTDSKNKVRPMMVLLAVRVMSKAEDAEASEAKERTEMTQTTTWTLATSPLLVASQYPLGPKTSGQDIIDNTYHFYVPRQRNRQRHDL